MLLISKYILVIFLVSLFSSPVMKKHFQLEQKAVKMWNFLWNEDIKYPDKILSSEKDVYHFLKDKKLKYDMPLDFLKEFYSR